MVTPCYRGKREITPLPPFTPPSPLFFSLSRNTEAKGRGKRKGKERREEKGEEKGRERRREGRREGKGKEKGRERRREGKGEGKRNRTNSKISSEEGRGSVKEGRGRGISKTIGNLLCKSLRCKISFSRRNSSCFLILSNSLLLYSSILSFLSSTTTREEDISFKSLLFSCTIALTSSFAATGTAGRMEFPDLPLMREGAALDSILFSI